MTRALDDKSRARLRERIARLAVACLLLLSVSGCRHRGAMGQDPGDTPSSPSETVTHLTIGPERLHTGVRRFGINLGGQNFYDSGQILRNLTFRNPGFEGEMWRSILRCKTVAGNTCREANSYAVWPEGFLTGAHYEILSGAAKGVSGTVAASAKAGDGQGVGITFEHGRPQPAAADFVLVSVEKPGDAQAGWWVTANGGASFGTEFKDLAPNSPGRQALRIESSGAGQTASVNSYFDSTPGRSFVQLRGAYTLQFRAKSLAGARVVQVKLERLDQVHGAHQFFSQTVALTPAWRDYSFAIKGGEDGTAVGTIGLTFGFDGGSALLDDVALTEAAGPQNHTAFRDAVVSALMDLRPGVLRYMDSGTDFGSTFDNMIATPFARRRAGASTQATLAEDVPLGLDEFLKLAQTVGAEPWYAMPAGSTPAEAAAMIEYLAGSSTTPYGSLRASLGQAAPWTTVFPKIHLELGNEVWNTGSFAGSTMADPKAYAQRADAVFGAMRAAPAFQTASFDLILGGWASVPWWTEAELSAGSQHDAIAVAPYLFTELNDAFGDEGVFGPMLAQPEQLDSRESGSMAQQAKAVLAAGRTAPRPAQLAVYEVNLGTMSGAATQADLDRIVPSGAGGLAVADHMLLMLRDLGVNLDCLFSLTGFHNDFSATSGGKETMPLWGAVVDMGGPQNLRRPSYLTLQAANEAILQNMLTTHVSGANPTWDQALSRNDKIELKHAHLIQSFAFAEGDRRSLIVLNLSRDQALAVDFKGGSRPAGAVEETVIAPGRLDDQNEREAKVTARTRNLDGFEPDRAYTLPPFSMTVLRWQAKP